MRRFEPLAAPRSSFRGPMAARAVRRGLAECVDFEQAVLGRLAHEPANSRVRVGRQKFGEVFEGRGRLAESRRRAARRAMGGRRPARSR